MCNAFLHWSGYNVLVLQGKTKTKTPISPVTKAQL